MNFNYMSMYKPFVNFTSSEYTALEIQFWSVNYMLVARICKKFEQTSRVASGVHSESNI